MTPIAQTNDFLNDLDRTARIRYKIAGHLGEIADTLEQGELDSEDASGKMSLEREIEDARRASNNLENGVFRLLVLGDMKRGKSTLLNALLGENLLPSDVNPCTALLTVLKYGAEKKVTVHFTSEKAPEVISFADFKTRYTIDPAEAKVLEQRREQAFPDVSHAVVEYPLPLLEKGVEIVDSPGLNDTEARNEMSLGFIGNCHAILFVMRASQPCTLAERRYLENYLKGRGLSIFFLINAWDQVKESLIDPDDEKELQEAGDRLRKVFKANLEDYTKVDGYDLYDERVFEVSAIQALRRRVKDTDADLSGTGFTEFMGALNTFLTQERAVAEMRQARSLGRQASARVQEAVARRLPMLEQDFEEMSERVDSVKPEFERLSEIRESFRHDIRGLREQKARSVADSFKTYVMGLENSFEAEFPNYQPPDLGILDALNRGRQEEFHKALEKAFQQYLNDKFYAWSITAEKDLGDAFKELSRKAEYYGTSYQTVTDQINEKLTGKNSSFQTYMPQDQDSTPGWAKWAMGLFSLASGNVAGIALAAAGFDFTNIFFNFFATSIIAVLITGLLGGPFLLPVMAVVGLGLGALQANDARAKINKAIKQELVKHLPSVAQEQWHPIYTAVQECFDSYEKEAMDRINDDIQSRQTELDNLLKRKQEQEINLNVERERLEGLSKKVVGACEAIESSYQELLQQI